MLELTRDQIRRYCLHAHHLDARLAFDYLADVVGACGIQNTPPGAWETSLFNRIRGCTSELINDHLYTHKTLLQAWSFRGAPVVFPTNESSAFLSALVPQAEEEWIYTHGIRIALDYLGLGFDDVFDLLRQVIGGLDEETISSKRVLDQTLADWVLPLLPASKRRLWQDPSMYGQPEIQTVGGAVVSFLLRPCAFLGLVVFGQREGVSPTFTSYKRWLGHALISDHEAGTKLTRKFVHCYGPTTPAAFADWLGCSGRQARRMWAELADELTPVLADGKKAFILPEDTALLSAPPAPERREILLGAHDPYLDQRDRHILLEDKTLQRKVWQMVSNPGAILYEGEITGIWNSALKGKRMRVKMTLWQDKPGLKARLRDLADEYAGFREAALEEISITTDEHA